MQYQKATFTLPVFLVEQLEKEVPHGEKSRSVSDAIQKWLIEKRLKRVSSQGEDPVDDFIELRKKVPQYEQDEISEMIEEGRK